MTQGDVPLPVVSGHHAAGVPREGTGLIRSLTLTHAVLYGVGVTIGAGIYVLVGVAAGRSGMHAPLGFLLAAIAMGMTAASLAELGTRMPVSASEAAYVERAFHRRWLSLGMGLMVVITATISGATISSGSAGYVAVFLGLPPTAIIVGVVLLMGAVACMATTQSIAVAGMMTLVEVGGLLVIIGAGMTEGTASFARLPEMIPSPGEGSAWMALGGTTLIAVFAFVGFEHIVNVAEEIKSPGRTLPKALFATLGITALLYGLVVWTAVTAVPPEELARSSAPLATVFERITGRPPQFMSVIAIVATLNGIVVHMIMIARVLYGLSSRGSLPLRLSRVNRITRTPLVATAAAVIAILLLAVLVPLEGLAEWAARGTLVIFAGVNAALIKIKRDGRPVPAFATFRRARACVATCTWRFSPSSTRQVSRSPIPSETFVSREPEVLRLSVLLHVTRGRLQRDRLVETQVSSVDR